MTKRRYVTISSASELEAVRKSHWFFFNLQAVVQVPGASREQNLGWQRTLNDAFQECGCSQGAFLSILTLGGMVGGYAVYFWRDAFPWRSFFFSTLASLLIAGFLGKTVGLIRARLTIARVTREIRKHCAEYPKVVSSLFSRQY